MNKIHWSLDKLTPSLLLFMGFDNKFKASLFHEHFWWFCDYAAVFLSSLSFSRKVVYVFMQNNNNKVCSYFLSILSFRRHIYNFFIRYRVSLFFERILQCLNFFFVQLGFSEQPFNLVGDTKLSTTYASIFHFFLKAKSFYLNRCTSPSLYNNYQKQFFNGALKNLLKFSKKLKNFHGGV